MASRYALHRLSSVVRPFLFSLTPKAFLSENGLGGGRPLPPKGHYNHPDYIGNRERWHNRWITEEAEVLMMKSYRRHIAMGDRRSPEDLPAPPSREELEQLGVAFHYPPENWGDKIALFCVDALKPVAHAFFREKYHHHACVLETVAAVPGMVGGAMRHMRSLRRMARDHGWIGPLLEEAENERMHLLIWMQVAQPTAFEKLIVLGVQAFYATFYFFLYALSPRCAHRFVGYLEEEAVHAYTEFLRLLDEGRVKNVAAPEIARKYFNLPDDALLRDVVLYVRADENAHRNFNHLLAELHLQNRPDETPDYFEVIERNYAAWKEAVPLTYGDEPPRVIAESSATESLHLDAANQQPASRQATMSS